MVVILQPNIFKNKTILITGAASGIGRGLAIHAASEKMNIILIDIDEEGLKETQSLIHNSSSLALKCDVSKFKELSQCKEQIIEQYGRVHFLFNNAGIFLEGRSWKINNQNWKRIIDVNVMSIVYGLNLFVDEMIASNERCHIVNTSSMAGLIVGPAFSPYTATKHAVVGLTRSLYEDLKNEYPKIGVSVLCPGLVKTNIMKRDKSGLNLDNFAIDQHEPATLNKEWLGEGVKNGMDNIDLAKIVFDKINKNEFWILTHPEFLEVYKEYSNELILSETATLN